MSKVAKRVGVLLVGVVCFSQAQAQEYKPFCEKVTKSPAGAPVPPDSDYEVLGKVIKATEAKEMLSKPNWLMIDTRIKTDYATGTIPKTLPIVAHYTDEKQDEFREATVLEKLNGFLKTKNKAVKEFTDLNFVLFCSGRKCHRTTYAACQLRDMGVAKDKIHMMLGGFPEWKEAGFPVK